MAYSYVLSPSGRKTYISLTKIAWAHNENAPGYVIQNWLRSGNALHSWIYGRKDIILITVKLVIWNCWRRRKRLPLHWRQNCGLTERKQLASSLNRANPEKPLLIRWLPASLLHGLHQNLRCCCWNCRWTGEIWDKLALFSQFNKRLCFSKIITPEQEYRKPGYVERKRRPYQGNVVRIA